MTAFAPPATLRPAEVVVVTPATQDYLAAIAVLAAEGQAVIAARLAEHVGVSAPAVTAVVRRLAREGYVSVDARKAIRLTATGRAVAEATLRRRRILERWLTDAVGFDWSEVNRLAHRLEHAVTPELAERLFIYLGEPATCPHGHPIPGSASEGATAADGDVALDQAAVEDEVVVEQVAEEGERSSALLAHLGRLGIRPGVCLRILEHAPWAGTITVGCGERRIVLGAAAARRIRVRRRAAAAVGCGGAGDCALVARVAVRSVCGPCQAGHQAGEQFTLDCRTPAGMCGEAFGAIFPLVKRLRGRIARGEVEQVTVDVPCPEEGAVVFRVEVCASGAAER